MLAGTSNPRLEHVTLQQDGFDAPVHALRVDHRNSVRLWRELRARFPASGYWPLLAIFITNGPPGEWRDVVREEADTQFNRAGFNEEARHPLRVTTSLLDRLRGRQGAPARTPAELIAASVQQLPEPLLASRQSDWLRADDADLDWIIEGLQHTHGQAPTLAELRVRAKQSREPAWVAFDRAIVDWELARGLRRKLPPPYWWEPDDTLALLLLPIAQAADALAHIHWFGSSCIGTPATMALLRQWQERYGAELMAHYGTVLYLSVDQPLRDPREAFEVAAPLETICMQRPPAGTAWQLLGAKHWELHNRP